MAKEDQDEPARSTDKDDELRSFRKGHISAESQQEGGFCPHCGRGDRRKQGSATGQSQSGRRGGESPRDL